MFIDIYFPPHLPVDRDVIQEELERQLGRRGEVVGAGAGDSGSNLDLELFDPVDRRSVIVAIVSTLDRLGVPDETILAMSDTGERRSIRELREWIGKSLIRTDNTIHTGELLARMSDGVRAVGRSVDVVLPDNEKRLAPP